MEWVAWLFVAFGFVLAALVGAIWLLSMPPSEQVRIKGRHVLITGGSSGIGLELALLVVKEGAARVSLLARTRDKLEKAQQVIEQATGFKVQIYSADVKDYGSTAKALASMGSVDVLICSHGVSVPATLEDSSLESINHQIDTNLKGNIHVIKAALPGMKENWKSRQSPASICIISSQAGQVGVYGFTTYAATKFGLRGLAEVLQQELLPFKIRMSLAFPPDTLTPGFEEEQKTKPELTVMLSASSKLMEAEDVAKKILKGVKGGDFFIPCNFDGYALMLATGGVSPHTSFTQGCLQVMLAGGMRVFAMVLLWDWYRVIRKWHKKQGK